MYFITHAVEIDPCYSNPCYQGNCVNMGGYVLWCDCYTGFTGDDCSGKIEDVVTVDRNA